MRERLLIALSVSILTVMLILTLTPLVLMFTTSFKPTGTLFQRASDVLELSFVPPLRLPDRSQKRDIFENVPEGSAPARWSAHLGQDMRRFSALEFRVRGERGGEDFTVDLEDLKGRRTSVGIQEFLRGGLTTRWETVRIPIAAFRLSVLTPGLSERIAEELAFTFSPGSGAVQVADVRLRFREWTLHNYWDVLVSGPFGRYAWNSLVVALAVTLANLLLCAMVGYAFARRDFPWKKALFFSVIGSIAIPPQVLMVPVFILMKHLGWLNTYWALIVPNLVMPFNIFLMRQYISKLPLALEEAARIDGASEFQIFWRVVLPLSRPALAVVGINTFLGAWNTFLYPFLLTNTVEMRTLPVGLALYKSLHGVDWVHLMAGSAITALPVIVVFLCFQRHIIEGLTKGSAVG